VYTRIDWESFKDTYNTWNKTNYKTAEEWIADLYKECEFYVRPLARKLGLSPHGVTRYLKEINIFVQKPRGGRRFSIHPGVKQENFLQIPPKKMRDMTIKQIAEKCETTKGNVIRLLKKHKREFMGERSKKRRTLS